MPVKKVDAVQIRMYRIGTGDCFVLKFLSGSQTAGTMMIDFGSCKGDKAVFKRFAKEIRTFVNDRIDVLAVSHEHLDHIIGFARGIEEFETIDIGQVWVAWTEDPTNALAKKLKRDYGKDVSALQAAAARFHTAMSRRNHISSVELDKDGESRRAKQRIFLKGLNEALGLYLDPSEDNLAAAGSSENIRAMEYVLKTLKKKSGEPPTYCYPGTLVPTPKGLPGVRFYVLAPPESEEYLKKEEIKDDVYKRKFKIRDDFGFIAALAGADDDTADIRPFAERYCCGDLQKKALREELLEGCNQWRSIDLDWLGQAGNLAIRLEKYINNTSLVLAIELVDSGKVLLFPGDAQSGNWQSWHDPDLTWTVKTGSTKQTVTAKDLLNRTVFYKVGHHTSHNGTASKSGLDLMDSNELVAFAPLDYRNISTGWKNTMPAPGLMKELIRRTKGRIFRIDQGLITTRDAKDERDKLSRKEQKRFENSYEITDDYIQYEISD